MQSKHLRLIKVLNQCKIQIVPTKNRIANIYLVFNVLKNKHLTFSAHYLYNLYEMYPCLFDDLRPKGSKV